MVSYGERHIGPLWGRVAIAVVDRDDAGAAIAAALGDFGYRDAWWSTDEPSWQAAYVAHLGDVRPRPTASWRRAWYRLTGR